MLGDEGQDSCVVSHAPVAAVAAALCLSRSTGSVWTLDTAASGGKLLGQWIFQTAAPALGRKGAILPLFMGNLTRKQQESFSVLEAQLNKT